MEEVRLGSKVGGFLGGGVSTCEGLEGSRFGGGVGA